MVLSIFKIIATSGFVTALERTKFVFCRGSAPDPAGGADSALPYTLVGLGLRGPTSKREERENGKGGKDERKGGGGN